MNKLLTIFLSISLIFGIQNIDSNSVKKAEAANICKPMQLIVVPGTWESTIDPYEKIPRGMLDTVLDRLDKNIFNIVKVRYPATGFPYEDAVYGVSKQEGVYATEALFNRLTEKCPYSKFSLLGFSQGSDVIGDLVAKMGRNKGKLDPDWIDAAILISDPRRAKTDHLIGPKLRGEGSGGPRPGGYGEAFKKVKTICAAGDLVCNLPDSEYWGRIMGFIAENSGPRKDDLKISRIQLMRILKSISKNGGFGKLLKEAASNRLEREFEMYEKFTKSGSHVVYPNYVIEGKKVPVWVADYLTYVATH